MEVSPLEVTVVTATCSHSIVVSFSSFIIIF